MTLHNNITPFLKWVGGKRQLLPEIKNLLPTNIDNLRYYEPFIGGGALLFELQPRQAVINDLNDELMNVYTVVKEEPKELINDLKKHRNTEDYYYEIRALDRSPYFKRLSRVERASRFIFLNKTCYNGLYRVNNKGKFNVPFGRYKKTNIINESVIHTASQYLNNSQVQILSGDYEAILTNIPTNSFVYLDPPYHPVSKTSNFTGYIQGGWDESEQLRLRHICNILNERGVKFLLSNSASQFIKDIYTGYIIHTIQAKRSINSNPTRRGGVDELLIRNYK